MARSPLPVIHHTTLTYIEGGAERTLEVGSSAWYAWLDAAAGFTYIGDAGTFTAHPEREARYWKAYRWVGGCRRRAYLGKAEGLSLERLAAAAAELAVSAPMAAGPQEPPGDSGRAVLGKVDAPPKARELAGALTSLPAPVGQLLGRQRERALARELLAGGARLLTLTGPGGVGKTRLAVALTGELNADLPDLQVAWADLTPLREPGLVPTAIAHAFGLVAWDARVPLAEALGARLHGQPALLVLDNCEQVLEGARAVGQLLDAVPELMVLATSREPLRLRAEQELPVPPLPLPYLGYGETLAQLAENPAVRLLVQRAQLVDPRFDLTESNARAVAEICVHLDGLPLAIELAAARTKLLPPEALLVRLDGWLDLAARARDIPHRHQTVRAAIDWSYDLLTAEEQAMFRRLAVFVGGCTIEAVATICAPRPESDALDCLGALVDKNLVLREPDTVGADPRFRLLEPVRDYALDSLTASGEGPVTRERHARFFTELAQRVGGLVPDPTQVRHFAALEPEQANLRAALAWYLESGTTEAAEAGLRLTAPLAAFWWTYGSVEEGVRWCGVMLERAPVAGAQASLAWVKTAVGAGLLYMSKGEDERAQALLEHGLALARAEGWHHLVVEALDYLSSVALHRGEFEVARRWLEEALPLARAIGSS
ncbi:MAG: hypothetical protein JOY61_23305, partial [Chloroflexi bacterium]|nr:hypothetical protein [Chloroflexota bacterium]